MSVWRGQPGPQWQNDSSVLSFCTWDISKEWGALLENESAGDEFSSLTIQHRESPEKYIYDINRGNKMIKSLVVFDPKDNYYMIICLKR